MVQSVALSGGYEDDEDHGEWLLYTGREIEMAAKGNKEMTFANGGGLTVRPWAAEERQAEELKVGLAAEVRVSAVAAMEGLSSIEELARATIKKLTQRMTEHNKAMASAKSDEARASVKAQKQNTTTGLQTCNNILAMTRV